MNVMSTDNIDKTWENRQTFYSSMACRMNSPEGTADAILPGDVRTLKQGRGPCPLRDDDGGGQAGLDHAPSGAER